MRTLQDTMSCSVANQRTLGSGMLPPEKKHDGIGLARDQLDDGVGEHVPADQGMRARRASSNRERGIE